MIATSLTKRARIILTFGLLLGQIVDVVSQSMVDASDFSPALVLVRRRLLLLLGA